MKISLTQQEYQLLLDMLYIATWIIKAHKGGDDPQGQPYEELEQKLFSFAKEAGYENLIFLPKHTLTNNRIPKYIRLNVERAIIKAVLFDGFSYRPL